MEEQEEKIVIKRVEDKKTTLYVTPREVEVWKGIVEGLTSAEIGAKLLISGKTVEVYRHKVMKRLKCHNTPHVIGKLFRQKIIV